MCLQLSPPSLLHTSNIMLKLVNIKVKLRISGANLMLILKHKDKLKDMLILMASLKPLVVLLLKLKMVILKEVPVVVLKLCITITRMRAALLSRLCRPPPPLRRFESDYQHGKKCEHVPWELQKEMDIDKNS